MSQHSTTSPHVVHLPGPSAMDLENAFFAKNSNVVKCSYLHEGKPVFENVQIYATGLPSQLAQDLGATILSGLTGIAEPDYRGSMGESLVDIVNFGLVYGITINYPHRLEVFLRLTSPTCHARKQIEDEVMRVRKLLSKHARNANWSLIAGRKRSWTSSVVRAHLFTEQWSKGRA